MARKKTSRKAQLKEPDKFISITNQIIDLVKKNRKAVLLGFTVLILVAGGWGIFHKIKAQRLEKAAELLHVARPDQAQPKTMGATLAALKKVVASYPDSGAAFQARLWRANLLYQEKQYVEAATIYQSLRGRDPGLDVLLAESLSFCYEGQQKYLQAAEVLEPLVQDTKLPYRGELFRRQALLYEQAGNWERALACYRHLLEQNLGPGFNSYIQEKIQLLEQKQG